MCEEADPAAEPERGPIRCFDYGRAQKILPLALAEDNIHSTWSVFSCTQSKNKSVPTNTSGGTGRAAARPAYAEVHTNREQERRVREASGAHRRASFISAEFLQANYLFPDTQST
ncbi:hypothetical protein Q5P01_008569 [Channa striata]|uniref:Uncharacterized protein n=1 Tax=Channa striata TaxID=64152 RepID=A0AA88SZG8_CHASR|nr:hypothetical protein Q5P01_008569 [Channa striata]